MRALRRPNGGARFWEIPQVEEDRQHIDVGEGKAVAGKVAALGDGTIEKADFIL